MFVLYCEKGNGYPARLPGSRSLRFCLSLLKLNRFDLLQKRLGISVEMLKRFHRLVRETSEAIDLALRELERAIALQVEGEDAWVCCILLAILREGLPRCVTTNPTLHVGEDDDARIGAIRLLEDRVEVRARRGTLTFQPLGQGQRAVALIQRNILGVVAEEDDVGIVRLGQRRGEERANLDWATHHRARAIQRDESLALKARDIGQRLIDRLAECAKHLARVRQVSLIAGLRLP